MNKLPKLNWEVFFILAIGLTPLLWYKERFMGLGHDMGFPLATIDHFLDRLYSWSDRLGLFGSNSVQQLPGFFIHGLEALLSYLGFDLITVQKITFIFWFTLPGITMYILLRSLHPEKHDFPIRLSGSLFYMLNHYLLQAWTIAERTKFSIVAAMPLIVLLTIKVLYRKESVVKNSILLALVLFFLNGGEGIPLWGGLLITVATIALIILLLSKRIFKAKISRFFSFVTLSVVLVMLLNAYWIYPYLKSYNETFTERVDENWGTAGAVAWSQSISANTSWINIFRLRGLPEWYNNPGHPYANEFLGNPALIFINLLLVTIALFGLLGIKKTSPEKRIIRISFLCLLLVAVPFAAGSHLPLGGIYDFALANVPGFIMFRSGIFKFGMVVWFAYAYLVAVGLKDIIDWLREKSKSGILFKEYKNKLAKLISICVVGVYVLLLLIYNYPYFTGVFFNWSEKYSTFIKVPDYIFEAKKELDKNKFSTRTLYLPNTDIRTSYIEYDWGYFSLVDLQSQLGRESSLVYSVMANPQELNLLTSIYLQYNLFGASNLLRFTSVDRAVLQNDFISPDYIGNPLTNVKDNFKRSDDFIYLKSVGKWDFYEYSKNSLPLIYSPQNLVYTSVSGENLYLLGNLPDEKDKPDALFWADQNNKDKLPRDYLNGFVIQAKCADCPDTTNYPIYSAPSKVLIPGSRIYKVNRYIEKIRLKLQRNPVAKIDFMLTQSSRLVGNLGLLIYDMEKENSAKEAASDLTKNLEEIINNFEKIKNQDLRNEELKKVKFFLNFFVLNLSQWKVVAASESLRLDLEILNSMLQSYLQEINQELPEKHKNEVNMELYNYNLELPKMGVYSLYIYLPDYPENTVQLEVDKKPLKLPRIKNDWFGVTDVSLTKSLLELNIAKSNLRDTLLSNIEHLTLTSKDSPCREINLSNLSARKNYKIDFRHTGDMSKISIKIFESSKKLGIENEVMAVYPKTEREKNSFNLYHTMIDYNPSVSADSLNVRVCALNNLSSDIKVFDFSITGSPKRPEIFVILNQDLNISSPDLEFVQLNQAKYLVKIKDVSESFVLNFNSRFNNGWILRKVNNQKANKYFTGKKKEYLEGHVIEYEKQDKHIITDLIFEHKGEKYPPQFMLNGFSNGWVIPYNDSGSDRIYLLEYKLQNYFYKAAGTSLASLVLVLSIYFFKYDKKKS